MIRRHYKIIVAAILLGFFVVSLSLAWSDALTFDEVAHISAGYSYMTLRDYRLNPEHPPLLKVFAGLALLPLNPTFDTTQSYWTNIDRNGEYDQWAAGRMLLFGANNPTDLMTFFARLPTVLLATAFGAFLFLWGKKHRGSIAGIFVLILYASDPTILGHNHFVTTDLGIAVAIAVACAVFFLFLHRPTWAHASYGGAALGFALVTKFSAMMLIPFFGVLLILYPSIMVMRAGQRRIGCVGAYLGKGLYALLLAVGVVWVVYMPLTYAMPTDVLATLAHTKNRADIHPRDNHFRVFILTANTSSLTRPFAAYAQGLMQVLNRVDGGNKIYFLHTTTSDASRWYFPFVFIAKTNPVHLLFYTIATLLGLLAITRTVYVFARQPFPISVRRVRLFVVRHFDNLAMLGFVIWYAATAIAGNLTIGLRHLFPIFPFIYLLTASTIVDSYKKIYDPVKRRVVRGGFFLTSALMVGITVTAYPYYMSYFNALCGGPRGGYRCVTDSNADWGQDAKRLATYLAAHPHITAIRVDYFGGDDIQKRIGTPRYIGWWDSKRPIEPGYYAISANTLQESLYATDRLPDDTYAWTRDMAPVAQIGTSIFIYHVAH